MTTPPSIAIIGGGIGGLFAANALIAHGLRVSVYEQASALGEIGAGVFVTPNAVRHLERVGLGPAVERWGARVGPGSHYFRHDGTPIAPVQVTDGSGWNAAFGMHRADLVELARRQPARRRRPHRPPRHRLRAGRRRGPRRVRQRRHRRGRRRGRRRRHPLRAAARTSVPPSKPVFHGTISYRGLVARERLPDWPMDRWQMWAGPSKHFLVFPVRHGTMVNYVGFVPTDEEMKESWSAPGDPAVLRREFEGWDPRIGEVLQQVDTDLSLGALRPRAAADLEPGPADAARRRRASDAAAPRPGRQPVDRGRHGAGDDPRAGGRVGGPGVAARLRAIAPRARRGDSARRAPERPALDSAAADLGVRDAQLAAHAEFRKHLYSYDVVPAGARRRGSACGNSSPSAPADRLT